MIEMIERLIERGYAYHAEGDVYFEVTKLPEYGKLSGQLPGELRAGARVEPGEFKRHPPDFALWKRAKPGEPSWDSPWGKGRPGWPRGLIWKPRRTGAPTRCSKAGRTPRKRCQDCRRRVMR